MHFSPYAVLFFWDYLVVILSFLNLFFICMMNAIKHFHKQPWFFLYSHSDSTWFIIYCKFDRLISVWWRHYWLWIKLQWSLFVIVTLTEISAICIPSCYVPVWWTLSCTSVKHFFYSDKILEKILTGLSCFFPYPSS